MWNRAFVADCQLPLPFNQTFRELSQSFLSGRFFRVALASSSSSLSVIDRSICFDAPKRSSLSVSPRLAARAAPAAFCCALDFAGISITPSAIETSEPGQRPLAPALPDWFDRIPSVGGAEPSRSPCALRRSLRRGSLAAAGIGALGIGVSRIETCELKRPARVLFHARDHGLGTIANFRRFDAPVGPPRPAADQEPLPRQAWLPPLDHIRRRKWAA